MIIHLADCPSQAWKNGLGRTRQIAVHPVGAGSEDFVWRVSIAEVDSAAPFSRFPGIDRHIVLLDGAGFTMTMDDNCTHALTTPFAPFGFAGEANVEVALAGGATRDFNLMVRRGRARGAVHVWRDADGSMPHQHAALIYCAGGKITVKDTLLETGDSWLNPVATQIRLHEGAIALVVCILPP